MLIHLGLVSSLTQILSTCNWQYSFTGWDNGLTTIRWQAIIWSNDGCICENWLSVVMQKFGIFLNYILGYLSLNLYTYLNNFAPHCAGGATYEGRGQRTFCVVSIFFFFDQWGMWTCIDGATAFDLWVTHRPEMLIAMFLDELETVPWKESHI